MTKKVGDAYAQWMSVVPIDAAELCRYDRNIPGFLADLSAESFLVYPRPEAS